MRLYAAPMEGVTGWRWRRAHRRWFGGCDQYYMPFLSPSHDHVFTPRELREIRPEHNDPDTTVPQLLTRSGADFLWCAGELTAMGYREVNLNLGCPSGTVVAKGKGAGLLGRREELERLLEEIFSRSGPAVSVKTRLGLEEPEEFGPLLELFCRYPISQLILHPRVRRDLYRAPVRPEEFDRAARRCTLPLCYNGGLNTAGDIRRAQERWSGLHAAMAGRALAGNPALLRQARGGPPAGREELEGFCLEVFAGCREDFGSAHSAMLRMKELWGYLSCLFSGGEKLFKEMRKTDDAGNFLALMTRAIRELELGTDYRPLRSGGL